MGYVREYNRGELKGSLIEASAHSGEAIVLDRRYSGQPICGRCVLTIGGCSGHRCGFHQPFVRMNRAWALKERKHGLCKDDK
jgi:hypothetical protein